MSETRDFVREEGKEKNSIIIVLLQAHTHIHAGETRFLSPLLYIYTYICVYMYQRCAATGHWLFLTEIVSVAASCFLLDGLRQPDLLSFRSN